MTMSYSGPFIIIFHQYWDLLGGRDLFTSGMLLLAGTVNNIVTVVYVVTLAMEIKNILINKEKDERLYRPDRQNHQN